MMGDTQKDTLRVRKVPEYVLLHSPYAGIIQQVQMVNDGLVAILSVCIHKLPCVSYSSTSKSTLILVK